MSYEEALRSLYHSAEALNYMAQSHLTKILWYGDKTISQSGNECSKKERKAGEKVGRQHKGQDFTLVWRICKGYER